jgi:hypothetical protein
VRNLVEVAVNGSFGTRSFRIRRNWALVLWWFEYALESEMNGY